MDINVEISHAYRRCHAAIVAAQRAVEDLDAEFSTDDAYAEDVSMRCMSDELWTALCGARARLAAIGARRDADHAEACVAVMADAAAAGRDALHDAIDASVFRGDGIVISGFDLAEWLAARAGEPAPTPRHALHYHVYSSGHADDGARMVSWREIANAAPAAGHAHLD